MFKEYYISQVIIHGLLLTSINIYYGVQQYVYSTFLHVLSESYMLHTVMCMSAVNMRTCSNAEKQLSNSNVPIESCPM